MKRVLVDRDIQPAQAVEAAFPDDWDIEVGIDADRGIGDAVDILLVTSRIPVTEQVIAETPSLEVIGKLGTGIDNVDLDAAGSAGIPVVYTPGYNALSVAELALGLLLATARRFTEARNLLERGRWRDEMTLGTRVTGKTVGIVGLGNVGKRFGNLFRGFNVDLCYHDPYVSPIDGELVGGKSVEFEHLLSESDFVCLMPELTAETRALIGASEFDHMSNDAILINTARGPVIDETALVNALRHGQIRGAGLDVFADEPLDPDSPLLDCENVVLTPHIGAMTHEDREKTIAELTKNVKAAIVGDPIDPACIAVHPDASQQ